MESALETRRNMIQHSHGRRPPAITMLPTKTLSAVVGLLASLPTVMASSNCTLKGPRIDLGYATYVGKSLNNGVDQFLGMSYAAPPVGDLRWRAPAQPEQQGVQLAHQVRCPSPRQVTNNRKLIVALVQKLLHRNSRASSTWSWRRLPLRQRMEAHQHDQQVKAACLGLYTRRR